MIELISISAVIFLLAWLLRSARKNEKMSVYSEVIASGSRDPKRAVELGLLKLLFNKTIATAVVVIILLLWLYFM